LESRVGVVVKVVLRGKRWNLETIEYLQDGSCGSIDPVDTPNKRVIVALNQTPQDLLDTVIHECLHGCIPDLDETCVEETATSIA
jgi:hypothetical protein